VSRSGGLCGKQQPEEPCDPVCEINSDRKAAGSLLVVASCNGGGRIHTRFSGETLGQVE